MHIDAVLKGDGDDGKTGYGLRAHGGKSGGAVDGVLNLPRDQLLDLLGRESRRLGLYVHLRRNEFGKDIERRAHRAPAAENEREDTQRGDGTEMTYAETNERTQHGYSESAPEFDSWARSCATPLVTILSPGFSAPKTKY